MDPNAAASAASFDIVHIFLHADWVVRVVMLALALASLWSWAVIIDKAFRFTALNREANRFEDEVGVRQLAGRGRARGRRAAPPRLAPHAPGRAPRMARGARQGRA